MENLLQKADLNQNNFLFLRYLAAFSVIFSHSFALLGSTQPEFGQFGNYGNIGVFIFFIISGFLITKSWLNNPTPILYFKKRLLRIFPALMAAILFTVFIIGPINTTLSLSQYFTQEQTWSYLQGIFLYSIQYNLPAVFANNPVINNVNGPLWTLPFEFLMYIFIAIMGMGGLLSKRKFIFLPAFLLVLIYLIEYLGIKSNFLFPFPSPSPIIITEAIIFFIAGSILYLYREKIYFDYRISIAGLIIFIILSNTPYAAMTGYFILPYFIICFAYAINIPAFKKIKSYGDLSYGLYIYAWPIQQTLVNLWKDSLNPLTIFIFSIGLTLIAAYLSWIIIEKPILKLNQRSQLTSA